MQEVELTLVLEESDYLVLLTEEFMGFRQKERETDDDTSVGSIHSSCYCYTLNDDDENWQRCVTLFTFNGSLYFCKIKVHNAADMSVCSTSTKTETIVRPV